MRPCYCTLNVEIIGAFDIYKKYKIALIWSIRLKRFIQKLATFLNVFHLALICTLTKFNSPVHPWTPFALPIDSFSLKKKKKNKKYPICILVWTGSNSF